MLKIGITGGIGSGKTTVSKVWESLGAYLIHADAVAKELMASDQSVKDQLIIAFGEESYHPDGSLNKVFLADEAFDKNRVDELNDIVHPAVFKETDQLMKQAEQQGCKAVVYEAAILLQCGRPERLDTIVLVLADEQARIKRVKKRDQVDIKKVENRIKKQENFENLKNKADIVIRNNGSLEELEKKAKEVYEKLMSNK